VNRRERDGGVELVDTDADVSGSADHIAGKLLRRQHLRRSNAREVAIAANLACTAIGGRQEIAGERQWVIRSGFAGPSVQVRIERRARISARVAAVGLDDTAVASVLLGRRAVGAAVGLNVARGLTVGSALGIVATTAGEGRNSDENKGEAAHDREDLLDVVAHGFSFSCSQPPKVGVVAVSKDFRTNYHPNLGLPSHLAKFCLSAQLSTL